MKKLYITNLTRNSNLVVYMGAYIDIIHRFAILAQVPDQFAFSITPSLSQMNITYKVYSDEYSFINDIDLFRPDAIFVTTGNLHLVTMLDCILSSNQIDIIYAGLEEVPLFKKMQKNWYSAIIYSPHLEETTYVYHTNFSKNIPILKKINCYQTIKIE